jgi:hypothetical protein
MNCVLHCLQAALREAELERMRRTVEEQLRSELNDALAKHNKSTWRDMLCCCFPRKQRVRCGCAGTRAAPSAATSLYVCRICVLDLPASPQLHHVLQYEFAASSGSSSMKTVGLFDSA